MLRIGIFFFLTASSIEVIRASVVTPCGSSVITIRFVLRDSMRPLSLIFPFPLLYSDTSIRPPFWKSGSKFRSTGLLFFSRKISICASSSSIKLCGRMDVDSPTAIPSAPSISINGSLEGKCMGSWFLPS